MSVVSFKRLENSLAIWVPPAYESDELFNLSGKLNRDNCLEPFYKLQKLLSDYGIICHTHDFFYRNQQHPSDILFMNLPAKFSELLSDFEYSSLHLLLQECEVVWPANWDLEIHDHFETVFTWSPDLYKQAGRYVRSNFSQPLSYNPGNYSFKEKKLCTMIAANKCAKHPLELYSARRHVIDWFEQYHPRDFDFYGIGWDRACHPNRFLDRLIRTPPLKQWFKPCFQTFHGMVESKMHILQGYRFCFCFENAQGINGYVTEKIFDAMMSGCVPVYLGAPDIGAYVTTNSFIDMRNFSSMEELVGYLKAMDEPAYLDYQRNIQEFLCSLAAQHFGSDNFSRTIAERIFSCA